MVRDLAREALPGRETVVGAQFAVIVCRMSRARVARVLSIVGALVASVVVVACGGDSRASMAVVSATTSADRGAPSGQRFPTPPLSPSSRYRFTAPPVVTSDGSANYHVVVRLNRSLPLAHPGHSQIDSNYDVWMANTPSELTTARISVRPPCFSAVPFSENLTANAPSLRHPRNGQRVEVVVGTSDDGGYHVRRTLARAVVRVQVPRSRRQETLPGAIKLGCHVKY